LNNRPITNHNSSKIEQYFLLKALKPSLIMHITANTITPDYMRSISAKKRKSSKCSISFATVLSKVVGVVPSRDEYTVVEKRNCWWTYRDQERSRVQVRSGISAVIRNGPVDTIENSYDTARKLAKDDSINTMVKGSNLPSSDLCTWTSHGVGRGLEMWISPYHCDQREVDSHQARTMVFVTQREGVSAQEISEIYEENSRSSLIYSIMMGEADSMCVSRQDDDKVVVCRPN
jgi:hypothetical protein